MYTYIVYTPIFIPALTTERAQKQSHPNSNACISIQIEEQGLVGDVADPRTENGEGTNEGNMSKDIEASLNMFPLPKSGTI